MAGETRYKIAWAIKRQGWNCVFKVFKEIPAPGSYLLGCYDCFMKKGFNGIFYMAVCEKGKGSTPKYGKKEDFIAICSFFAFGV